MTSTGRRGPFFLSLLRSLLTQRSYLNWTTRDGYICASLLSFSLVGTRIDDWNDEIYNRVRCM